MVSDVAQRSFSAPSESRAQLLPAAAVGAAVGAALGIAVGVVATVLCVGVMSRGSQGLLNLVLCLRVWEATACKFSIRALITWHRLSW